MNVSAIYSRLQGVQAPIATDPSAGAGQGSGRVTSFTSFEKALANQMSEQAGAAAPSSAAKANDLVSSARGFVGQMVDEVQNRQAVANQAIQNVLQGEDASLHKAVIAMDEATLSFQLLIEMRNKVVESLQEMMRMQV